MKAQYDVLVVGGGIMGLSSAYYLALKGSSVMVLDQFDVPNQWAASGEHLRSFGLTYGKDVFYTEMAVKSIALWQELDTQSGEKFFVQNGMLELATDTHGYEEQSCAVLKEMRLPAVKMGKEEVRRHYPMINTRAIKYALFHKDGGMIWARRATAAISMLAQRKSVRVKTHCKAALVLREKNAITGIKDSSGKVWRGGNYLFTAGAWTPELLKNSVPLKITCQQQIYVRPPSNRGRYRPEHFPVFYVSSQGFSGFPLHIHGFMKIAGFRQGPAGKPGLTDKVLTAFDKKCRIFLKRYIPELAAFTESEGSVSYFDNTKDGDFIMDRLSSVSNGYVACGFAEKGLRFAPLIGKTMAELITGAKPELNLHRFRLSRLKSSR